jgi:hypothetical protein
MTCELYKYKREIATHYVGKGGNEYLIRDYNNWGRGKTEMGKIDLPLDEYPYTIKYKTELVWLCCKLCSCDVGEIK